MGGVKTVLDDLGSKFWVGASAELSGVRRELRALLEHAGDEALP